MHDGKPFENCDAETVLDRVALGLRSTGAHSLWNRLRQELHREDVGASLSYVRASFSRIDAELRAEICRLESES